MECAHCRRDFIPRSYNARYCGIRCKERATQKRRRDRDATERMGITNNEFAVSSMSESDRTLALARSIDPKELHRQAEEIMIKRGMKNADGSTPATPPSESVLESLGYSSGIKATVKVEDEDEKEKGKL